MSLVKFGKFLAIISFWGIFQPHPRSSLLDRGRSSVVSPLTPERVTGDVGCLGYRLASGYESPASLLFHPAEGLEHLILSSQDGSLGSHSAFMNALG